MTSNSLSNVTNRVLSWRLIGMLGTLNRQALLRNPILHWSQPDAVISAETTTGKIPALLPANL
uniref:Uncharacterized protein n=1 Tax=Arundo donax TaxID=35708 RepID=A0A0A8YA95_ARUDO